MDQNWQKLARWHSKTHQQWNPATQATIMCDLQHCWGEIIISKTTTVSNIDLTFPGGGSRTCSHHLSELYGTGEPAVGERQRHSNETKVESKHGDAHCCS